mgnify:CR=1 FL=1
MPKYQFAVEVLPEYLPEESEPEREVFAFAYTITITNTHSNNYPTNRYHCTKYNHCS